MAKKFIWSDLYSLDNKELDGEHRKLISIYNEMVEYMEMEKPTDELARLLSELTDYSLIHFNNEDNYMKQIKYPLYTKHISYHRQYIYKVAMFNVELMSPTPPDPGKILRFINQWWKVHILKHDKLFEEYKKTNSPDLEYSSGYFK